MRIHGIWYQPASVGVVECIGFEAWHPKRFLRVWANGDLDHGWVMHETARCLWSINADMDELITWIRDRQVSLTEEQLTFLRSFLNGNLDRGKA
jgi:hypothetical protein